VNGKIKGKGKEYFVDGSLKFEGEYNNDVRNGKGKEYYNDELTYDGEFLNGRKHGKGIEYNYWGKIEFEGEFLNDMKWNGKFKEYNDNGEFIREVEYLNGEKK